MRRPEGGNTPEIPWGPAEIPPQLGAAIERGDIILCPDLLYELKLAYPGRIRDFDRANYNKGLIRNFLQELGLHPFNEDQGDISSIYELWYTLVKTSPAISICLYGIRLSDEVENRLAKKLGATTITSSLADIYTRKSERERIHYVLASDK